MKNFLKNEKTKKIFFDILYPLIAFALVIAIWAIVAKVKNKPLILPSPDVVLKNFSRSGERRDSGVRSDFPCFELYGVLRRRF